MVDVNSRILVLISALVLLLGSTLVQAHAHLDEPAETVCVLCSAGSEDPGTTAVPVTHFLPWQPTASSTPAPVALVAAEEVLTHPPRAPPHF